MQEAPHLPRCRSRKFLSAYEGNLYTHLHTCETRNVIYAAHVLEFQSSRGKKKENRMGWLNQEDSYTELMMMNHENETHTALSKITKIVYSLC